MLDLPETETRHSEAATVTRETLDAGRAPDPENRRRVTTATVIETAIEGVPRLRPRTAMRPTTLAPPGTLWFACGSATTFW